MSAAQHTPGPWRASQGTSAPRMAHVWSPDERIIADVWNVPHTQGAQALADARLIAAAPELLQALKGIVALWDHHAVAHGDSAIYPLHQAARAAIDKATGGAA